MSARHHRQVAPFLFAAAALVALTAGCSSSASDAAAGPPASVAPSEPSSSDAPRCPNSHGGSCLGLLDAGEYRTTTFDPETTYTVPDGWMNMEDLPGNFQLYREDDAAGQTTARGGSYLGIYTNVHAAAIDCREAWQEEVGHTPTDLVAWYQSVPGLIVSEPEPVTVGGLDGLQLDVELEPGDDTCDYGGNLGIPLFIGDGVSEVHHAILEEMDIRLVLLAWGDGNLTLEITNVREQHSAEEFRSQVQSIVDSLGFAE
ncbi:MAG TPA: hypothetical protein VF156_04570 [Agromyces sp.]